MLCKYCGNEMDENTAFCPKCGKSQMGEGEISSTPTLPSPEAEEPVKHKTPEEKVFEGLNPKKPEPKKAKAKRVKNEKPVRSEKKVSEEDCNPPSLKELFKRPLNILYLALALACLVPNFIGEYRRIVSGVPIDGIYWLLVAPTLITLGLLFVAFGLPYVKAAKARAVRDYEKYGSAKTPVWETVNKVLVALLLVVAAACFVVSLLVRVIG